nr:MAG TPA: hypothetical protein [Caudoviricetes sp.]
MPHLHRLKQSVMQFLLFPLSLPLFSQNKGKHYSLPFGYK